MDVDTIQEMSDYINKMADMLTKDAESPPELPILTRDDAPMNYSFTSGMLDAYMG